VPSQRTGRIQRWEEKEKKEKTAVTREGREVLVETGRLATWGDSDKPEQKSQARTKSSVEWGGIYSVAKLS